MPRRARSPRTAARVVRSATLVLATATAVAALQAAPAFPLAPAAPPTVVERLDGLPSAGTRDAAGRTTSRAVAAPVPFAMVGFDLPDEEAEVEVRWSVDGTTWSAWTDAPHYDGEGPDPGTAEADAASVAAPQEGTHPVWTGAARHLQVRVAGAAPEDVGVTLLDPLGLGRSAWERAGDRLRAAWRGGGVPAARAVAGQPPIVSRAEWGADESMRTGEPAYARRLEGAFVHHTVSGNDYSAAEAPAVVRGVYAYHVQARGWGDIGYNVLIDRFGTIYEGRFGGVEQPVIGAQAMGFNTGSTGVAVLGTFAAGAPPQAAFDALDALLAWRLDLAHIDPLGTREAVSRGSSLYPEGAVAQIPNLAGHRDVQTTDCPGDGVYSQLPVIRERVRARIGDAVFDHRASLVETRVIRGDPDAEAVELTARIDPPGPWTIEVRSPAGAVVHSAAGDGAQARSTWRLDGTAFTTGTYRVAVASPGRRTAEEAVELRPPEIVDARPDADVARATPARRLRDPVTFTATLWRDAAWTLTVTAPDGTVVHADTGTGDTLRSAWDGEVPAPGTYRWRIAAEDATPHEGTVEVRIDRFTRIAEAADAVGASVALSREAFDALGAEHAVLARADVFADAMAGGPLAGPDGPLLLTASDALDPRVRDELMRVLLPGSTVYLLGGEAALAPEVAAALWPMWRVERLSGAGRAETAAEVARAVAERTNPAVALIARAGPDDAAPWADALAGGAYGAAAGIPVLLTDTDRLPAATADVLADLGIERTLVLGGEGAVSAAVAAQLPQPQRVAGADRTATAVAVARDLWGRRVGGDGDRFLMGNGYVPDAWPLALAAAPLAARTSAPLLLTGGDGLAPPAAAYLGEAGYASGPASAGGAALGGPALVPQAALDHASDLAG